MKLLNRTICICLSAVLWVGAAFGAEGVVLDASRFQYEAPWALREGVMGASEGTLLAYPRLLEPAEVRIDPGLQGPYRIVLGLHHEKVGDADELYYGPAVMVRLDNDPYRVFLTTIRPFAEVEFKVADMTGRKLVAASLSERPAFIDYVRFEPVDPDAFAELERQRLAPHQKDVVGINDVNVWMWRYTSRSEQDFRDIVGQHQWAGFNRMYWMANAGALFYHSEVGTRYRGDYRPFTSRSGHMVENFRPLESGVKAAREMGLEIWGWYRLNNNFASPADLREYGPGLNSEFFMKHPEFRLVRADGSVDPSKYSFAFPEVRAYVRGICVEMARKGVEGLMLDLLRHPPLAGYEPPLVEGYLQQYGIDPRAVKPTDTEAYAQWIAYRARHSFTQFVIELCEDLKRLGLPASIGIRCALGPFAWNRENGMDVEDLVQRELVREICLMNGYLSKSEMTIAPHQIAEASKPYLDLCRGRTIRLICGLHGRGPGETLEYAKFIHDAGYDGVAIYESELLLNQPANRAAFRELKFLQTMDSPWLTASSARDDQLVPWQPAVDRPGEWWQLNLPQTDRLTRIALRFDRALPASPEISVSEDGFNWRHVPGVFQSDPEGWMNLTIRLSARHVRVVLPASGHVPPQLLQAQLDFEASGSIRIGEVRDGRVRIISHQDGAEVTPGVKFEAGVKGLPQTSKVEFNWDGILIRTEREAPFIWFTDTTLRPGLHRLKVRLGHDPLAPSIDEIKVRVIGPQAVPAPLPPSSRLIAFEDFESLPEGGTDLPKGWYFSKGLNSTYMRGTPEGSVRTEQIGGSRALRIVWSGQGPRMYVNLDFGSPVARGMVEFDVMVPDVRNQRLAGLFEGADLNLAMYLVDRGERMTYNSGAQSHQNYSPPVVARPGVWRHVKWEWDTSTGSQTIYIDDMKTPLVKGPGIRKKPSKGIDRFGIFFFENQPGEIILDNVRAAESLKSMN